MMMKRNIAAVCVAAGLLMGEASGAFAVFPRTPVNQCANDAIVAGSMCMDKYEASVWRVPNPTTANANLVNKIRRGQATLVNLAAGGATQLGTTGDDYAPCADDGQNCANDIYAVSLAGVTPAATITWFQAQEACANAGKRLPTSAEWQVAANGTPDTGTDNGPPDCNTIYTFNVSNTGSRSSCVSARGAFDMVGNLYEWVADWVPRSAVACQSWGSFSDDEMCLSGTTTIVQGPGALLRGGYFFSDVNAGPLAVDGRFEPKDADYAWGFRCAR